MTKAAGILIRTKSEGQVLFLKRGPSGDHPGEWCFPGGKQEEGESLEEAARRECKEEIGSVKQAKLQYLCRNVTPDPIKTAAPSPDQPAVGEAGGAPLALASPLPDNEVDFTTFLQIVDDSFEVEPDNEHVGFAWAPADQPPQPLHPGCQIALDMLKADELDIARMIADGRITSPQRYKNITFFALRVTGTEFAFRREKTDGKGKVVRKAEWAWREPEIYLNQRFCDRCAGLPVIYYHPEKKPVLDSEEFNERVVGAIMFAYIKGSEVWSIARIYDDDAITIMLTEQMSTSPGVLLTSSESQKIDLDDGTVLLIEGKPSLLDHLAVCKQGVWDKGGDPAGVAIHDSTEEKKEMSDDTKDKSEDKKEEPKQDAVEKLDAIMDAVKGMKSDSEKRHDEMSKRLDAMESRCDAFEKGDEKKDAADDEKKEDKKDSKKDDGDDDDEEEGKAKEMKADKKDSKKDEDKEEKEEEKHDAVSVAALKKEVADLRSKMPVHQSDEEYGALITEQARADDVYQTFGKNAPRPLLGETPTGYRKRVASELRTYSSAWKNIDISKFDDNALAVAYDQICNDAVSAANRPSDIPEGQEIASTRRDKTGHMVTTFRRAGSFVRDLSQTARACVKIDTNPGRDS